MFGYNKTITGYRPSRGPSGPPEMDLMEEQVGVQIGLESVQWIEIITEQYNVQEEVGVSAGLEGIEWVEV